MRKSFRSSASFSLRGSKNCRRVDLPAPGGAVSRAKRFAYVVLPGAKPLAVSSGPTQAEVQARTVKQLWGISSLWIFALS